MKGRYNVLLMPSSEAYNKLHSPPHIIFLLLSSEGEESGKTKRGVY